MEWNTRDSTFRSDNLAIEAVRIEEDHTAIVWTRCNNSVQTQKHTSPPMTSDQQAKVWVFSFLDTYSACVECGDIDNHGGNRVCRSCEFFVEYVRYKNTEPTVCAICQENVFRFALPCGHMFHKTCMNRMEHGACRTCPVCRADIPYSVICRIFDQEDASDFFPDKDDDYDDDA